MSDRQFEVVTAYKCRACGAVLLTGNGVQRHAERCSLQETVDKDQLSLLDMIGTGGEADEEPVTESYREAV